MNKSEFLKLLYSKLAGLEDSEIKKSLNYYSEMIDDRVEDGELEEEAVASLGDIDEIVDDIQSQSPPAKQIKGKRKIGNKIFVIILIILGSPIWLSILLALFAVVIAIYATVASIIIALFSVVVAFLLGGAVAVIGSPIIMYSNIYTGIFIIGAGLILFGLGVFSAYGTVILTKLIFKFNCFLGRKFKRAFFKKKSVVKI